MKNMKNLGKRSLSVLLAMVMCLGMLNLTAFAVEEHTHNQDGWTCKVETTTTLICGVESGHTHTGDCYAPGEFMLTCEDAHHTDECYIPGEPVLTCGDAHHTGDCCIPGELVLTCGETGHTHSDSCSDEDGSLICEAGEHTHGGGCYTTGEAVLTCGDAHHTGDCYAPGEPTLNCGEAHQHDEGCYGMAQGELICGEHAHTEECWITTESWTCTPPARKAEPVIEETPDAAQEFLAAVAALPDSIETGDDFDAVEAAMQKVLSLYQTLSEEDQSRDDVNAVLPKLSKLQAQLGQGRPVTLDEPAGPVSYDPGTGTLTIAGTGALDWDALGLSDHPEWQSATSAVVEGMELGTQAFSGFTSLQNVTLTGCAIGANAFSGCELQKICVNSGCDITLGNRLGGSGFNGCTANEIVITDCSVLKTQGAGGAMCTAFGGCTVTKIIVSDPDGSIVASAFFCVTGVTTVEADVASIGASAFYSVSGTLKSVTVNDETEYVSGSSFGKIFNEKNIIKSAPGFTQASTASYAVTWYGPDGTVIKTETREGFVGAVIGVNEADKVLEKRIFDRNNSGNVESTTLAESGTELKLYFKSDQVAYTVEWYDKKHDCVFKTETRTATLGSNVTPREEDKNVAGYKYDTSCEKYFNINWMGGYGFALKLEESGTVLRLVFEAQFEYRYDAETRTFTVGSSAELKGALVQINAGPGEYTIRLDNTSGSVELSGEYDAIKSGSTVTLLGGGVTVCGTPDLQVNEGAALNLGSSDGSDTLTFDAESGRSNSGFISVSGGTVNMYQGVTLTNLKMVGTRPGAVNIRNGGTFNMYGGTISNIENFGKGTYGGGVSIASGTFNMSGGVIQNCKAYYENYERGDSWGGFGGGVFVGYSGTGRFNMTGGSIENCESDWGGGVYVNGGSFTMSGDASISGCKATVYGGGVAEARWGDKINSAPVSSGSSAGEISFTATVEPWIDVYEDIIVCTTEDWLTAEKKAELDAIGATYKFNGYAWQITYPVGWKPGVSSTPFENLNTSSEDQGASAIVTAPSSVDQTVSVTMTGGSITGNSAGEYGGGVCATRGTFTRTGGVLCNNAATKAADDVFTSEYTSVTLGSVGTNWTLTETGRPITGWYLDESPRWSAAAPTGGYDGSASGALCLKAAHGLPEYTVTYKWDGLPNGATGPALPEIKSYAKDAEVTVDTAYTSETTATVGEGDDAVTYVFSGWSQTGNFKMPAENVVITGSWTEKKTDPVKPALTEHTLTINYVYANGGTAAAAHTENLARDARYSVASPGISGYTADKTVVSGTMPDEDVTVTVVYTVNTTPGGGGGGGGVTPTPTPDPVIPDVEPPLTEIPDEEPPLAEEPGIEIDEPDVPLAGEPEIEIGDPDVPLADVPKTGDNSGVWTLLTLLSGAGLVWLALADRKRRTNAK